METTTLVNPYFRLAITFDPKTFYGSFELVRFILETISEPKTIAPIQLFGFPGMGKSTLLRYIAHPEGALRDHRDWLNAPFRKEPERLFPVLVEFRLLPRSTHPFVYLYERFYQEYQEFRDRFIRKPDIELLEIEVPSQTSEEAITLLKTQCKMLAAKKIRPVLLLDDFDLPFEHMSFSDATALRPFLDYAALVMAIGQPLHLANKEAAGSPLFQSTPLRRLEGLSPEEAKRLLEEPARKEGKPFPLDDVEFILSHTSGHPYLIILAGRALWDMRRRLNLLDTTTPLQTEERTMLLGHLAKDFGLSFELYWRRLDPKEREILKIFSQSKKPLDNLEKSQYKFLSNLLELGLVKYVPHSGYETFSPLFADFIETVDDTEAGSNLTGFETRLLDYLRRNANRVCTYEELWQDVWNQPLGDLDREQIRRRMQVTVSRLRQKLQPGEDIISIRDQGYKLI